MAFTPLSHALLYLQKVRVNPAFGAALPVRPARQFCNVLVRILHTRFRPQLSFIPVPGYAGLQLLDCTSKHQVRIKVALGIHDAHI